MKKLFFILSFISFSLVIINAQIPSEVYDKPLKETLDEIQHKYNIVFQYDEKKVKNDFIVTNAYWKICADDLDATLTNVLLPLNLRYNKKGNNVYEIKQYEYFRKPESEGASHLNMLLNTYTNLEEWEIRKNLVRENIFNEIGLFPLPERNPLNPQVTNKRNYDGYSVENVSLEVLPGVYLCGSLYTPVKKRKAPAMLCPHGHFYNKIDKSIPNERGRYRPDQQYRCAMLARMGVVVFSYDMFAWGESNLQVPLKDHRTGLALTMQIWNAMRAVDFLSSLSYVDKSRIGITGASGGGTQTFLTSALDERIALSVPTVMVSCHFYGGCPCESGLPIHHMEDNINTNNAEIAALFAPRPQLLISDGNDWTSNTPVVEYPYIKTIYSFYNKQDMLENAHFEKEKHDYGPSKRFAMYNFVAHHFNLDVKKIQDKNGLFDESKVIIEPAESMYAFGKDRELPTNAVIGADEVKKILLHQQYISESK